MDLCVEESLGAGAENLQGWETDIRQASLLPALDTGHATGMTFSEEGNLREVSFKTRGFGGSIGRQAQRTTHSLTHYPWLSQIELTLPAPAAGVGVGTWFRGWGEAIPGQSDR